MARGTGKQLIFEDDVDRRAFLDYMDAALARYKVELYAWCLMSNHVHLLLSAPIEDVSECMRVLLTRYARHFNERHGRVGHLYQERFKSEPVNCEAYLMTVLRYIHRNPTEAGLGDFDSYRWSSYREYFGKPVHCETAFIETLFGGQSDYVSFHEQPSQHDACLDEHWYDRTSHTISDTDALAYATDVLGGIDPADVKAFEKNRRNECLRKLREEGFSARQIERMTGISKSVVARSWVGH
jgi:REP element-mobilizing transposase RayT